MLYFYGDPHFGEEDILRYEHRPFGSGVIMDKMLVEYYNSLVTKDDEVIFTGDLGAKGCERNILMQMNGKKYLVKGNHDTESNEYYRKVGFIEVYDKPIILDGFWIVSHEPMYVSDMAPYANIYAHVHNNPMYRTVSRRGYCTCVDRNDFRPVSFDDIKEKVRSCN